MSEFDIRIGTLLDTSKAEEELQNFINKYSGGDNDFKINLKISGDEKLEGIEKSLNNIKNLAKSIGNIKMDFDGGGLNVDTAVNESVKKVKQQIQSITKELGTQMGGGVESSVKNVADGLENEVESIQKKIKSMISNLNDLKLNPFADSNGIDDMITKLNQIDLTNIDKFGNLGLGLVKEEIDSIINSYNDLYNTAKNKQLDDIFQTTKVEPLREQMLSLKEVMNFKNLDTSGLDKLIQELKKTGECGDDLKKAKTIFDEVKKSFANFQNTSGVSKSIKTFETAIQELLKYRNKLENDIRMEVDTSKIQQAEADIKRIDDAIDRLRVNSDESIVKNLFDMSELKNMENMENASKTLQGNLEKLENAFDKLKTKANQLSNLEFVDLGSLASVQQFIQDIEKSIKSLDFDNLKATEINQVKEALETLEVCINNVVDTSKKMELEVNFANDLQKAEQQVNGLESALIKLGQSTDGIGDLRKELSSLGDLAKVDLNMASTNLKSFTNELKGIKDLGDISGSMSQFKKYVDEIVASTKKLLTVKDVNFANAIKQEVNQTQSALAQLMKSFDETERKMAMSIYDKAFDGLSESITKEVNKIQTQVDKLNTTLYKIGKDINFDDSVKAAQLVYDLKQATQEVESLQNAIRQASNTKMSIEGIEQLKENLEQAEQKLESLKKQRIELDCTQAIQKMEKLKNSVEDVDDALDRIGGADAINKIVSDFENGITTFDKATASIKKFDSALDKIDSSSSKISKSFDGISNAGTKIEGVFDTIKNAFSTFTLGELLEEGIENLAYGITETITGLDEAMTHLKMVSDDIDFSGTGYEEVANQAREMAISVGQSVEDIIEGMATAYQAGAETIQQATAIAEKSAMLQNVSELDATGASQAIASLMNQYYSMDTALSQNRDTIKGATKDYSNLEQAIDLINYAGNNYAITTEGVTEALQNGGATLSAYGVGLADSVALISGANESLQDAGRVGNGLKTIAINMAGLKTSASDGSIQLNKTAMALKEIAGIDVFTDSSQTSVKDMMTLMDELNGKWGELTEAQQLALSEGIAGKTQSAVFQSLMSGWSRVKQLQSEYKEGFTIGSAEKENEVYLDSISGKWNVLKENLKGLLTNNVSTDFIKGLLDGLNNIVTVIDKVTSKLGTIGTGGALIGIISFVKSMSNFSKLNGLTGMAKVVSTIFTSLKGGTGVFSAITSGFSSMAKGATVATVATAGLQAVLSALGWGLLIAGVALAVKAWSDYTHATEKAIEASKEREENYRSEVQSMNSEISSLSSLAEEYDTLTSKTKLTADEYARLKELKQQIAEINPDLVTGYDVNGDPILALNGNMKDYIASLQEAIKEKQKLIAYEQETQAKEYMKDTSDTTEYKKKVKKLSQQVNGGDENQPLKYYDFGHTNIESAARAQEVQVEGMKKNLQELTEANAEYLEMDNANTTAVINNLTSKAGAYTKLIPEMKTNMDTLIQSFDLGDLELDQYYELTRGLETLSEKSTTIDAFGKTQRESILNAKKAYEEGTGSLENYGNAINSVFQETGKVDLGHLNEYISAINKMYSETGDVEAYESQMKRLATTLSELMNIDYDTAYKVLKDGFNFDALQADTVALDNFLKKNQESIDEWAEKIGNGGERAKQALKENFGDITNFVNEVYSRGGFDADWLKAYYEELPNQLKGIADTVLKDGEATEVEQKFMVGIATEIANEGEVKDETIKALQDILEGAEIPADGMEIGSMYFNADELAEVKSILDGTGWSAEQLAEKLRDNGFEQMMADAEALKESLASLNFADAVNKEIKKLSFNNVGGLDALKETLNGITSEEKQIEFVAECGDFFAQASSMEEAIQNIISQGEGAKLLKFGIEFTDNAEYTRIKDIYDNFPESIKTLINTEVIGYGDIDKIKNFMEDGLTEKQIKTIMEIDGATEVLSECSTVEEFLTRMADYIATAQLDLDDEKAQAKYKLIMELLEQYTGEEHETTLDIKTEGAKEELEEVDKKVEETNNKKAEPKVDPDTEGAKEELEEVDKKVEETNNKKAEPKVDPDTEGAKEELEEVDKKVEEADGKTAEPTVDANTANAERKINNVEKKIAELDKDVETNVTINIEGREVIQATIGEKGELEVDGMSKTKISVEGEEAIPIAINEKGQLEVNGIAQTHIQIKDGEQLTITRNEKGELEVNGQAVTTVTVSNGEQLKSAQEEQRSLRTNGESNTTMNVDGLENVEAGAEAVEELPDEKSVSVSFNVNDALDSILGALGLSKKKETIEITVKAIDEASKTLDKINGYEGKTITFTIQANGGAEAAKQVETIGNTPITNKTFGIVCTGGETVSSQVKTIATTQIPNKTFSVTANTSTALTTVNSLVSKAIPNKSFTITCNDSASSQISALTGRVIPNKTFNVNCNDQASKVLSSVQNKKVADKKFTINCTDNASKKITSVQNKKIKNKSFTVSCTDNASTKLSNIITKLGSIVSKSITITTTYKQVGSAPNNGGTPPSASSPQVVSASTPIVVNNDAVASTMATANNIATTSAKNYTDTILASQYWSNQAIDHSLDLLQDYTAQLDRLSNKLDIIDTKMEGAFGNTKASLLRQQIKLLEQQQDMLKLEQKDMQTLANSYKNLLRGQGFKIDSNGAVTNATSKILELEHALEKAQKAQDAYTGDNESKQKSLAKATENAQEKLNKAKETLSQYYETSNKVGETEAEWREIANAIAEAKNEIYEATKEAKNFYYEANSVELEYEYDKLADQLEILQSKMDLTDNDEKKIDLLHQQLEIIEQQRLKNLEIEQSYRNQMDFYKDYLSGKGFTFDEEGNITNGAIALDKNKTSEEIESIQNAYEEYMTLQRDTLPDLEKDWYSLLQSEKEINEEIVNIEEELKELEKEAKELEKIKILDDVDEITRKVEQLEGKMNELNHELEMADGDNNKIALMKQQIELLNKQMSQQNELTNELEEQANYLRNTLSSEGFNFDSDGNIANLDALLNAAETQDAYDEIKEKAEEYYDIQNQITDSESQWRDYQLELKETQEEIENMKYELQEMKEEANLQEFMNDLDVLNNKLEKLQAIGDLNGTDTLSNLNQQLDVIKQQQQATEDLLAYQLSQATKMQNELSSYGFQINDDGTIDNTANQLEYLKGILADDEFERVSETLEEYFDVALGEIPELENQLIEYQRDYQDILEQKLEATEKIEQEITKIIEKQIEDRIEEIEKERDAQVEALEEQKNAYQKWREEVDYEDDYNEQLSKVQELQAQLEIAKRDDSLSG